MCPRRSTRHLTSPWLHNADLTPVYNVYGDLILWDEVVFWDMVSNMPFPGDLGGMQPDPGYWGVTVPIYGQMNYFFVSEGIANFVIYFMSHLLEY